MSALGKAIAALVFAGLVGAILLGPVLDPAGENQGPSSDESPSPTKKAKPTPKPSPSPAPESTRPARFLGNPRRAYPHRCLRPTPRPSGQGFVAAFADGRVQIASVTGGVTASFEARPPIQWSPSGRYLVTRGGHLWTSEGAPLGQLEGGPPYESLTAWSPIADCAVFVAGRLLKVGRPRDAPVELLRARVVDLAFSPDGSRLALVIDDGRLLHVAIANLTSGHVARAPVPAAVALYLFGWTRGGRLFYGSSAGESVAADGLQIRHLWVPKNLATMRRADITTYRAATLAHSDFFALCGDGAVIVEGAGRETTDNKRLVFFGRGPRPLTAVQNDAFTSPACSPDARYIAAIRAPDGRSIDERQLVLLSSEGSLLDDLTPAQAGADEYPSWGPPGVVFVMRPPSGPPQIWFIPEGGTARPTGLTVRSPRPIYGHFDWGRVLDWSGDTPSGAPSGV